MKPATDENMEFAFFDTETTDLPNKKLSRFSRFQPHIVQLALIVTDNDANEKRSLNRIIKPDGYTKMAPEAEKAHGISFERAMDEGLPRKDVIEEFLEMSLPAYAMVAHNIEFDRQLLDFALFRTFGNLDQPVRKKMQFCTMRAYMPIIKIPPTPKMVQYGFGPYKNPTLTETHEFLFGEGFDGAHDALNDVRATIKAFFKLDQRPRPRLSSSTTN